MELLITIYNQKAVKILNFVDLVFYGIGAEKNQLESIQVPPAVFDQINSLKRFNHDYEVYKSCNYLSRKRVNAGHWKTITNIEDWLKCIRIKINGNSYSLFEIMDSDAAFSLFIDKVIQEG